MTSMRIFKTVAAVGVALVAVSFSASVAGAKTLKMADSTDIAALDPHSVTESNTFAFLSHIYEPLVRYNGELKVEPSLAKSWEVIEPTRWRFHLREGVKYHDGRAFSADDAVASIMRSIHPDSPI